MRVLVLGIGNVMFGDEGFGAHFAMMMERNFKFHSSSHTLKFIDGGTLAIALTPIITDCDYLIVVDCISADGGEVGELYFFDFDDVPAQISWSGSAHEVEMLETLQMTQLAGDLPRTKILGVIPHRIEPMSFELSAKICHAANLAQEIVLEHLKKLGFSYEKIGNLGLQDMANEYKFKGLA